MNEFRRDPITGRWVIISPDRDTRPNQFRPPIETAGDTGKTCPFCANQMDTPPIVAEYGNDERRPWQVCVVPNLYPVLNGVQQFTAGHCPSGLSETQGASGLHEVVIESPAHVTAIGQLTPEQVVFMLRAYRDRMMAMKGRGDIAYAQVMKNSGMDAGASLSHTHSQIFGLPFAPEQIEAELRGCQTHFEKELRCVFCELIAHETADDARLVCETDEFVVWCPHASRFGYETWIAPRTHAARFEEVSDGTLAKLGSLFQLILQRIEQNSRIEAFNYLLHSLPFDSNQHDHYHWHIEIIPRTSKVAGFEWGTGIHVNTIAPERAAKELRN